MIITKKCLKCGDVFEVNRYDINYIPKKEKTHCSRKCANSHIQTKHQNDKRSAALKKSEEYYKKNCELCGKSFIRKRSRQRLCSLFCASKLGVSCHKKYNRSKNEIYFSELCKLKFKNVLTNEKIFNGWDADIIIEDLKIAVLWNGKWHYEKITKKHSVAQVQNRDKIKISEIIKCGYQPYIIKDLGKYKKLFVEEQFKIFIKYCSAYL